MHKEKKEIIKNKSLVKSSNQFPVVGIGASAGGLDAFKKLLKAIPENSGMAYVLVQHLDPNHESLLPELLQKVTSIPVREISDDIKVEPDHIYIIPSNKMMIANDGVLELSPRPAKSRNERNLPIDLFFSSLAEVHQSHAIGVVLSGTASDGTLGLKAIKDHGGITFAQDEESAEYEGMPHSAVQAGVVDFILPPGKIPEKLLEVTRIINGNGHEDQSIPLQDEDVFRQILALLRLRKGTDFTYYKQTTIRRRMLRRMALNKIEESAGYLTFLRENKPEQDVLFQDLLIPVTSFFRDPKSFDNLCETVFPLIAKNKTPGEIIRLWVAGCSTGQEVYSVAICLKEFLGYNGSSDTEGRVQIFATDISEPAIAKARTGIYTKSEVDGLSPQRLQEFFTKTNGSYQANKSIRDMCVFAIHNFLKDPPFGKMDFVSCRNVLIYMEPYLQKKALTIFHYALNPKGFLLLGKSETISSVPELFASGIKHDKIFSRKDVPGRFIHTASQRSEQSFADMNVTIKSENIRTDFQKTADDIILGKYSPAGVVVNEAMDIVHFRGSTGNYLEPSPGKASLNLLKMAKNGLGFELRNILHKAKKDNAPVTKENIPLQANGNLRNISIEAIPLPNMVEPHYLILFHDIASTSNVKSEKSNKKIFANPKNDDKDLRIHQLEKELAHSREDMRSITEDQEAVNEELQSANEELLSGSEELQSLNEELETSKEELQSTNEELMVVNQEMIGLNEQVSDARDYAEAIVTTVREPLLVLDKNLRVKSANIAFYKTFQVNEKETEGRLLFELGDKQWNIPELRTLLEEILPRKTKFADFEVTHNFQNIGARVMLLNAREITREKIEEKLILLAIEDITEKATARKKIEESESHFRQLADLMPAKISNADIEGKVLYFNKNWLDFTGFDFQELKNFGYHKIIHPDELEEFQKRFQKAAETGTVLEMEMRFLNKDGDYKWHLNLAAPVKDENGNIKMWVGVTTEIQQQKEQEGKLENAVKGRTQELLEANEELQQKNQEIALSKYNKRFLSEFSDKFSAYKGHNEFFSSLVQFIADTTGMDYVFVGKLMENEKDQLTIQTIALNAFGKPSENINYPLPDGPCEQVIRGELYSYPRECRQTFPKNKTIEQFNVEGYLAYPLNDEKGNAVGLIAVMHQKEIEDAETVSSVLKIVAKRAEIELERIKNEDQLVQHNTTLEEKNEELVKMNKELQAFTYVSSHDLQEPLRKIQNIISHLVEKENQSLSAKAHDYFRRIQESAKRMQTLIQDLLAFSHINNTDRIFENIWLDTIIEKVKIDLAETIKEKNATIEASEMVEVKIIPFLFHQLFSNLISNSLKFSIPGKPAHIIIKSKIEERINLNNKKLSPQKRYCHISLTDNGIGFDPQHKDRIFELFQRLHGKEEYSGTGVGLAIVKKIVDNHNGIITASSELNEGARFDIYIPA